MPDLQSQIIISQQKQIRKLEAENHQLKQDAEYLKKVLSIALRDYFKGTPLVISQERMREIIPDFSLDENLSGDTLIWSVRK